MEDVCMVSKGGEGMQATHEPSPVPRAAAHITVRGKMRPLPSRAVCDTILH